MDEIRNADGDGSAYYFDPKFLILKQGGGGLRCFVCGSEVNSFPSSPNFTHNAIYSSWSKRCAKSLTRLLKLDASVIPYFENGIFCPSCLSNIRELDFLIRSLDSMQIRLKRFQRKLISKFRRRYESLQAAVNVSLEDSLFSEIDAMCPSASFPAGENGEDTGMQEVECIASPTSSRTSFQEEDVYHPLRILSSPHDDRESDGSNKSWVPPDENLKRKLTRKRRRLKRIQKNIRKLKKCSFENCKYSYTEQNYKLYQTHVRRIHEKAERPYNPKLTCNPVREAFGPVKVEATEDTGNALEVAVAALGQHEIARRRFKMRRCEYGCKFYTYQETLYTRHVKKVHLKDPTPYHCGRTNCGEKFADRGLLDAHCVSQHRKKSKPEGVSPRRQGRPRKMVMKVHQFFCKVEDCDYSHYIQAQVERHERKDHENHPNPYHCHRCPERFEKAGLMWKHVREKHSDPIKRKRNPKLVCVECGFIVMVTPEAEAKSESQFESHLNLHRRREAEGRKFSCVLSPCEKSYITSFDLKKHVLSAEHEVEGIFRCELCDVVLRSEYNLREHVTVIHLGQRNPWKCTACGYKAQSDEEFGAHRLGHINSQYVCTDCGKIFKWKVSFRNHMLTHSARETWPLKCTFVGCGKRFIRSGVLRGHQETHSTTRSYVCEKCSKDYKTKKGLDQHCRLVHKKETQTLAHGSDS